jgi:hypothetical protein
MSFSYYKELALHFRPNLKTSKSNSNIYGETVEQYVKMNIKCFRCGNKLCKLPINEELRDFSCSNMKCLMTYQVKGYTRKYPHKYNVKVFVNYEKVKESIERRFHIDWIVVNYDIESDKFTGVFWIKHENLQTWMLDFKPIFKSQLQLDFCYIDDDSFCVDDDGECACGCRGYDTDWVQCDNCPDWYLQKCVGLSFMEAKQNNWVCPNCYRKPKLEF